MPPTDPPSKNPDDHHPVAVTAIGISCPLGAGLGPVCEGLANGTDAVTPIKSFDVSQCRCRTAGQIPDEWLEPGPLPKSLRHPDRSTLMCLAAIRELVENLEDRSPPDLVIIGTTSGGMVCGQEFFRTLLGSGRRSGTPGRVSKYMPQKPVLDALARAGWPGVPCRLIANACASGANAIGTAFQLVRAGRCRRVLCGGYDAISELVHVGFDSLQAATPDRCRPFDRDRSGMVLGEGAAFLMLEAGGHPAFGKVAGYGSSNDNHHLTQPHPDGSGPRLAMERALADAGCRPTDIGYINAHGTATPFNDAAEGRAICDLFGDPTPPVSSTKSAMGHSLGAAGAIEAVFTLLALREGLLPANLHFNHGELPLDVIAPQARRATFSRALSNAFGFGGTNAALVLEGGGS